jgi:hypothetical protein
VFVSVDSVGEQAEYIRSGLDYNTLQANAKTLLQETNNTTLTYINTFNALSVPRFKDFLRNILEMRCQFSKTKQGIKYVPIHDPYHTHPDHEIHPRQRVWFDVPLLRNPAWQSIHILPEEYEQYIVEAIDYMKANSNVDDFVGFYDFEIEKVERNLAVMQERSNQSINQKNFVQYFTQYDQRKGTDFAKTFPELASLYTKWA